MSGVFVAIDGPNGVGKSAAVKNTAEILESQGLKVLATREPTNTPLGRLAKALDGKLSSEEAYACLIAADRREHAAFIRKILSETDVVLSDRYLPSSLVLNVARGVSEEFVLAIHNKLHPPELTVILTADAKQLKERLRYRNGSSFPGEPCISRQEENKRYEDLISRLPMLGYPTRHIDTSTMKASEVAIMVAAIIRVIR